MDPKKRYPMWGCEPTTLVEVGRRGGRLNHTCSQTKVTILQTIYFEVFEIKPLSFMGKQQMNTSFFIISK